MLSKKTALYLVVGGLALDVIDAFTTKAGTSGGALYGPTGPLAKLSYGKFTAGELVAIVGAIFLFMDK